MNGMPKVRLGKSAETYKITTSIRSSKHYGAGVRRKIVRVPIMEISSSITICRTDPPEQPEGDQSRWRPRAAWLTFVSRYWRAGPGGSPMVTVGLSLPKDGPDQIAALR